MFSLPPLPPTWDGFHPLLVHIPIGLLIVAPVPVLMGLVLRKHELGLNLGALAVMALGTAGAFLAVSSGEAAEEAVNVGGAVHRLIEEHGEVGEFARTLFVIMTLAFSVLVILPRIAPKMKRAVRVSSTLAFLALYCVSLLPLMNAGHLGGELVHTHGVRARLSAAAPAGVAPGLPPATGPEEDDDD